MKPHIIKSINNPDGSEEEITQDMSAGQPIPEDVAKTILDILEKKYPKGAAIRRPLTAIILPVKPVRLKNWIRNMAVI